MTVNFSCPNILFALTTESSVLKPASQKARHLREFLGKATKAHDVALSSEETSQKALRSDIDDVEKAGEEVINKA